KELLLVLSEERPRNHLDMRNRLNSQGKREGKLIDYRVSELRAVEILDGLCKKMDKYSIVTKDERRVWSSHRDYSRSANTDRKKLIREEQGKEIKRWCDRVLEEYEDDITAQLRSGDLNMDADVPALLCARITGSCKAKALQREVLAADDGSSPSSGLGAQKLATPANPMDWIPSCTPALLTPSPAAVPSHPPPLLPFPWFSHSHGSPIPMVLPFPWFSHSHGSPTSLSPPYRAHAPCATMSRLPAIRVSATISPSTGGGLVDVTDEQGTSGADASDKAGEAAAEAVDEL
ncbi:unnamed protein product, partial [Closterium sp. Naga37s-1]